jgi:hypothetical protein
MEGTIAAALEPHVQAWFLDVNGGSLFPELAAHSPAIGSILSTAATFNFGLRGDTYDWSHPLVQIIQQIVEPGDPITYAPYVTQAPHTLAGAATQPRNVIQTEAIWDDVVTDEANEALARAAGWGLALPNVGSNADVTDPADAGGNLRATPLANVSPDDAGTIHDTPVKGSTAVVVQCGPCQHGVGIVASKGEHVYAVPYLPPYTKLATPIVFAQDYRGFQQLGVSFFTDAFNGVVPRVNMTEILAPIRDEQ